MRYVLALTMALAIGIASMVPAAQAASDGPKTDRTIYRDGQVVLQGAVPFYPGAWSGSSTVAGPASDRSLPYQEQHYKNQGH
jgi:hypothetical protein